jgi:hypothetical protein
MSAAPQLSEGTEAQGMTEQAALGSEYEAFGKESPQKQATPYSTPAKAYDSSEQAAAHHSRELKGESRVTVYGKTRPVIV